jgi:hypothetical protein
LEFAVRSGLALQVLEYPPFIASTKNRFAVGSA